MHSLMQSENIYIYNSLMQDFSHYYIHWLLCDTIKHS